MKPTGLQCLPVSTLGNTSGQKTTVPVAMAAEWLAMAAMRLLKQIATASVS